MDLNAFNGLADKFEEGVEIEILHPSTSQKTGLKVRVISYQSEKVHRIQRKQANASMREARRNPKKVATVEEVEEKAHDLVCAVVVAWSGFERDGKVLECNAENVRSILKNPDLWFIGEQIDKAADDLSNFMKASA